MTKEETIKIMAMLGAFYSGGKNDPRAQANAWYLVLKDFDYAITEKAVIKFAKNDTRDYATFPAVGKIVEVIKQEEREYLRPVREILDGISYGKSYEQLSEESKELINETAYLGWLNMDAEKFEREGRTLLAFEIRGQRQGLPRGEK